MHNYLRSRRPKSLPHRPRQKRQIMHHASHQRVRQPPTASTHTRAIKRSPVMNQVGDTEVPFFVATRLKEYVRRYLEKIAAEPPDDEEPSPEQFSALHHTILARDQAPYADFAIFGPLFSRQPRNPTLQGVIPTSEGIFHPVEVKNALQIINRGWAAGSCPKQQW